MTPRAKSNKNINRWVFQGGKRVPVDPRMKAIVAELERGDRQEDIARRHGISQQRVSFIREFAGIPARRATSGD